MSTISDDDWVAIEDGGFAGLAGPFLRHGSEEVFGFQTDDRHRNANGVVQGGAIMTFADRVMGIANQAVTGAKAVATLHLDVHFLRAVQIGDFVRCEAKVVRDSASLVFMAARLMVEDRTIATANGIWKKLDRPARR